ncbi:WD40 repeat domain-containing protein [Roseibacillus persicicus]|uniref:hypothetical protein n=1 Tax=Roseibacillus persicicus TaxID=454148 RepID=UPI00398B47A4
MNLTLSLFSLTALATLSSAPTVSKLNPTTLNKVTPTSMESQRSKNVADLSQQNLKAIGEIAKGLWKKSGLNEEQIAALDEISYRISDLGGENLGSAKDTIVTIDDNAAGSHWFIDLTPNENSEFLSLEGQYNQVARQQGPAWGGIDLLTVILHEQGHVLGMPDSTNINEGLMFGQLAPSERRLPRLNQAAHALPGSIQEEAFIKLNDSLAHAPSVSIFQISPDSSRVVWTAVGENEVTELYCRALDGSDSTLKLNDTLPAGSVDSPYIVGPLSISPDSSHVVWTVGLRGYSGNGYAFRSYQLYSRPIDGSESATLLYEAPPNGAEIEDFHISSDSNRVVWRSDATTQGKLDLYSRAIDGSGEVKTIDGSLSQDVYDFQISPDSSRVVWRMNGGSTQTNLYSQSIDGTGVATVLNDLLPDYGEVTALYSITPDSSRVVWRAKGDLGPTKYPSEIYSRNIDGSGDQAKLTQEQEVRSDVYERFLISGDSNWVIWVSNKGGTFKLYSRAVDGSSASVLISDTVPIDGDTWWAFSCSPDSSRVVWSIHGGQQAGLYSSQIDESGLQVRINSDLPANGQIAYFSISPDSSRVVWRADGDEDGVYELYSRAIDGSGLEAKLNDSLTPSGDVSVFQISPDSNQVVWNGDGDIDGVRELYARPIDGSGVEVKLNNSLHPTDYVSSFKISPDSSRVVWNAFSEIDGAFKLFTRTIDGSGEEFNLNNDILALTGDVSAFKISPNSQRVVWVADGNQEGFADLYGRALDGSNAQIKINLPYSRQVASGSINITPDSSRVYWTQRVNNYGEQILFSQAIDGNSSQMEHRYGRDYIRFSRDSVFQFSPDSTWMVAGSLDNQVYSAKVADSRFPNRITSWQGTSREVKGIPQISSDSNWVVAIADKDVHEKFELYRWAIDGYGTVKLNEPLPPNGDVVAHAISADSSLVLWTADAETDGMFELYQRALDRSSLQTKVNNALPAGGGVINFATTPDSNHILWRAVGDVEGVVELYTRPVGDDSIQTKINNPLPSNRSITFFQVSPDSQWVVWRADGDSDGVFELYSRPIDGSSAQVKLNETLPAGGNVNQRYLSVQISPDSSRVVWLADGDLDGVEEVYSRAIDGSGPQVKLNDTLPAGGNVLYRFLVSSDSSRVVWRADGDTDEVFELYSRAIDGSGAQLKLNPSLPEGGNVGEFDISPDSNWVVYLADGDVDEVFELYSERLTPQSLLEDWRSEFFGNPTGDSSQADLADFDGDGIANLLEFAFGTDPTLSGSGVTGLEYAGTLSGGGSLNSTGSPIAVVEPGEIAALFVRRKDHLTAGLTYTPQFSHNLVTWEDDDTPPTVLAEEGNYEVLSLPYAPLLEGESARFFRVSVSIEP